MEKEIVRGFKVFNSDWTCTPNGNKKQYTCPGKFEEDITPEICGQGMHFCKKAVDCFNYYSFNPDNKVAEVIAYGDIVEQGDKCCTNKLELVREIPWTELLEIVNTGKSCTGLCNSGDWNSGNWNKTNFSNGCFNTVEPKIHLFNKPSEWTYRDWLNSEARYIMNKLPVDVLKYICLENMTDEEKAAHPEAEVTGGYLKQIDNSKRRSDWWSSLEEKEKEIIKSIPNFDKEIFKEITGIDVE